MGVPPVYKGRAGRPSHFSCLGAPIKELTILIVIVGWASRPSIGDGRDAHPTFKSVSYLIIIAYLTCLLRLSWLVNPPVQDYRSAFRGAGRVYLTCLLRLSQSSAFREMQKLDRSPQD
jgi:hypothetical protein